MKSDSFHSFYPQKGNFFCPPKKHVELKRNISEMHNYPPPPGVSKTSCSAAEQAPPSPHTLGQRRPSPKSIPTETHLLCDAQPLANQIGIVHNVPVREGGSFGASRCPLKDTGQSAMTPPFPRMSYVCSLGLFHSPFRPGSFSFLL